MKGTRIATIFRRMYFVAKGRRKRLSVCLASGLLFLVLASLFQGVIHELVASSCRSPGCVQQGIFQADTHDQETHQGCTTLNCSRGQTAIVRPLVMVLAPTDGDLLAVGQPTDLESTPPPELFRPPIANL